MPPKPESLYCQVTLSLPRALIEHLDLLFYDPSLGKPQYGARSRLVTDLLQAWLDKRVSKEDNSDGRERES